MNMTKIIIQGKGTVGQSTELFLKQYNPELEIVFNDPNKDILANDDDWKEASWVVICVDTSLSEELDPPENDNKNVDDAINFALEKGYRKHFVLRSTVGIDCVRMLTDQLGQYLIVCPEYIREATWKEDSINPGFVVVGGEAAEEFSNLFNTYTGNVIITDTVEAMIAKLTTNTFLAMKVVFANQIEKLCKAVDASYDVVKVLLENEGRLGRTHWVVPGPDGLPGYGGKCFPKDVKTLEAAFIRNRIHQDLIRAISDVNSELRPNE